MEDITMMPDPGGRWVMMCACGATEIRAQDGPSWAAFELSQLGGNRYRITCHACGHATEHLIHHETAGIGKADQTIP